MELHHAALSETCTVGSMAWHWPRAATSPSWCDTLLARCTDTPQTEEPMFIDLYALFELFLYQGSEVPYIHADMHVRYERCTRVLGVALCLVAVRSICQQTAQDLSYQRSTVQPRSILCHIICCSSEAVHSIDLMGLVTMSHHKTAHGRVKLCVSASTRVLCEGQSGSSASCS